MAIGVFDGIHLGHQALLQRIVAKGDLSERYVFTFKNNPKTVLGKKGYDKNILTVRQKVDLLTEYHVENIVLIDFSSEFSKLRGEDFFTMISNASKLRYVVIGENFRCGHRAMFSADKIQRWYSDTETDVEIVPSVLLDGVRVSSSFIRRAILHGDISSANSMLGRVFSVDMANIPHRKGKTFDIELHDIKQILPPPGSYNVTYICSDNTFYHGKMSIKGGRMECMSESCIDSQLFEIRINDLLFKA